MPGPKVFIAGAGRQSVAAAYDLLRFEPRAEITLSDRALEVAEAARSKVWGLLPDSPVKAAAADVTSCDELAAAMRGHDVALAGVPYHLNPAVHRAARQVGIPSVDMGSDLPDLEAALGLRSEVHSSLAVFDSGLAPGLGNQLAAMLIGELPGVVGAKIYCGGLPLKPRTAFKYRPRFSLEGLVGEYSDPAVALAESKVVELEALSGLETIRTEELGELEAFVTSGGASIGPLLHQGKLETYEYKTLRFPGHCAAMRAFRDLGLWKEENFAMFARLFEEATASEDEHDQIVLIVEAWSDSARKRIWLRHEHDPKTNLSAMEQLTGFSAAIVVREALHRGGGGLLAAEEVAPGPLMLEELARRGIRAVRA
jgi:lysine 6-dehydrogenase